MAEMIPDRLPSGASAGEKKVFALLQQLPDEVIVYYEPVVAGRYPDFIVIIPSVGLLVIEAKGWYPNHILEANNVEVTISPRGQPEICKHPVRQARDYQYQLMDTARRHPESAALLQSQGAHVGRFIISFWSPCGSEQLHTPTVRRARAVGSVPRSKGVCSGRA